MDWFERLTGFREAGYHDTRKKLKVDGRQLQSLVNGKSYGIGELELVPLRTLRERTKTAVALPGGLTVGVVTADVRKLHQSPEVVGALFQVASQFNLLEMVSSDITPEHGVTRYKDDHTQGPACAIACGAATIYRNYFAPVEGGYGQTKERQFNGLADIGETLSEMLSVPVGALWKMQNGYALCTREGLKAITKHLSALQAEQLDDLRGKLRIGLHRDVEVTEVSSDRPKVSQAFCSALPVGYSSIPSVQWKSFASLILEAAYEATLWAAVGNAQRGASNVVLLTLLGGGAFGNDESWIFRAIRRALGLFSGFNIDVKLVSYRAPSRQLLQLAGDF